MEDVIKVEAKDFVISGIEKFSGGGIVNYEVRQTWSITVTARLQVRQRINGSPIRTLLALRHG